MTKSVIHSEPSKVDNRASEVIVDGPDGVDVSMTPEAAAETGARLIENAAEASGKAMIDEDVRQRTLRLRHS